MKREQRPFYRLLDHTADLGLEIDGSGPAGLFVNAAWALFEMLVQADGRASQDRHSRRIEVQGADWADLMVNWLRELLYLFNDDRQVLAGIHIQTLSATGLQAVVASEDFASARHRANREIKAVTYHQVQVGPQGDRWMARVIFDI